MTCIHQETILLNLCVGTIHITIYNRIEDLLYVDIDRCMGGGMEVLNFWKQLSYHSQSCECSQAIHLNTCPNRFHYFHLPSYTEISNRVVATTNTPNPTYHQKKFTIWKLTTHIWTSIRQNGSYTTIFFQPCMLLIAINCYNGKTLI